MGTPGFAQRYRDSRAIFGASWRTLGQNQDLWRFPLAAGVLMIIGMGLMFSFMGGAFLIFGDAQQAWPAGVGFAIGMLVMLPFGQVMSMLMTAMVHCLLERWEGRDGTPAEGWAFAKSRGWLIFRFNVIAMLVSGFLAAIGMLLDKLRIIPGLGAIFNIVGAFGWATAAFFVIPAIAAGKAESATDSIRQSVGIAREQWGKSVAAMATVGMVITVPLMIIIFTVMPLIMFGGIFAELSPILMGVAMGLLIFVPMMLIMPLQQAVLTTYQAALYHFATTGNVPNGQSRRTLVDPWEGY